MNFADLPDQFRLHPLDAKRLWNDLLPAHKAMHALSLKRDSAPYLALFARATAETHAAFLAGERAILDAMEVELSKSLEIIAAFQPRYEFIPLIAPDDSPAVPLGEPAHD